MCCRRWAHLQDNHKLYLVMADHSVGKAHVDRRYRGPSGYLPDSSACETSRRCKDGFVPQWIRVVEDGKPAVLFNVYEQPDGNAVQIAQAVHAKLAAFKLPSDVRMENWYDQSELVTQSAGSVRDAVLIGLVLAGLVLILFLRKLAGDADRHARRAGDAGDHGPGAERRWHELQHHDAWWHRRRGRAADRRRHRHGRAYRPPGRRAEAARRAVDRKSGRAGGRRGNSCRRSPDPASRR